MSLADQLIRRATRESLSPDHVEGLLAVGAQLVDVRPPADARRNALPGAVNLPIDALRVEHRRLNTRRPVIVYGANPVRSSRAARLLAGHGFSRIYHFSTQDNECLV